MQAVLVLLLVAASEASAHPPAEATDYVESADGSAVLRTTRGLVFRDTGGTWRWLCTEGIAGSTVELPRIAAIPGGGFLIGTAAGMHVRGGEGCRQGAVRGLPAGAPIQDVESSTDSAGVRLLALTSVNNGDNGLYESRDGYSWQLVGATWRDSYGTALAVSEADPSIVWMSGGRLDPESFAVSFFVWLSRDGGVTWDELPVVLEDDERQFDIVTSAAGDEVAAWGVVRRRALSGEPDRLARIDAGGRFERRLDVAGFGGVVELGPTLYVGGHEALYTSEDGAEFSALSCAPSVRCLTKVGDDVIACGRYASDQSALLRVGSEVTEVERFESFHEAVGCGADSEENNACAGELDDWIAETIAPPDGAPKPCYLGGGVWLGERGGCRVVSAGGLDPGPATAVVALLFLCVRRQR